ncbi:thyrotroph embryonic factor isoform X2 [Balaenoptera acutorostrata]|uniref:Thyrotroph embryonic factor isoform X2 n=1 Tax=Balaenoptera acutorostrata TaxID=9767 RepID=A0A384AP81_BALAC|nr:thyrotroph embryonic factor isoform X2 [Balaenoptera acutorostrata]
MSSCDRIGVAPAMDMPEVLKSLLEHSLPWPEKRTDKEKGKEKLEEDEAAAASTMAVSASLMPPIWDKTIPYDGESFHLEYMDLDEFLLENGIPASPTHLAQNLLLPVAELEGKESASSSTASPPSSSTAVFQPSETVSSTESSLEKERETPSPIDPNCVEVDVNFNPDPADLVLSSVPGGELFNPRKHKFAEEDLKPQPMIKKAKKVFVPDEQKPCLQTSQSAWKDKRYTDKNRRMTDCGLDLVIRDIWPMAWLRMALRSLVDAVRSPAAPLQSQQLVNKWRQERMNESFLCLSHGEFGGSVGGSGPCRGQTSRAPGTLCRCGMSGLRASRPSSHTWVGRDRCWPVWGVRGLRKHRSF